MRSVFVFLSAFLMLMASAEQVGAQILAQYRFDETGGTTAFDSAGAFNGTLSATGSAFVAGGISGNAISLNRPSNGYVNMGNVLGFPSGNFSVVMWVKTTTTEVDTIAMGKHEAFTANGYFVGINPTGGGGAADKATFVASENVNASVTSTSSVNDGAWHQIVGVYNAGGNQLIYVDGAPVEALNSAATAIIGNAAPFLIGGINVSNIPTSRYTGLVDEVQIYSGSLSPSNIDFLFLNPTQIVPVPEPTALVLLGATVFVCFSRRKS